MAEISQHVLTQLPGQEEKCWRKGRMEITRSQLSQGPRGCSWKGGARTREIHLSGLFITQRGRDFTWTAWDCCFPRFGNTLFSCSSTFQSQQHPLALARKGETPKRGIEEIPTTTNLPEHKCCTHRDARESCSVPVLDGDSSQELGALTGLVVLFCASVSPLARAAPLWQNYSGIVSCCLWKLMVPMALLS